MLDLEFDGKAERMLSKCEAVLYGRLMKKIRGLQQEPFPTDVVRVKGRKEKVFRVRVGGFRILYVVMREKNVLFISEIDKRPRVY